MKVYVCMKNDHCRDPEVIAVHLDLEKAREWMRAEYLAYRGKAPHLKDSSFTWGHRPGAWEVYDNECDAPYLDLVITEHDTDSI